MKWTVLLLAAAQIVAQATVATQAPGQGHQALSLGGGCYMGCVLRQSDVHWCPASTTGELRAAECCPRPVPDGPCAV